MKWASASSDSTDSARALVECAAEIFRELNGEEPDLIFAFLSDHHRKLGEKLPKLLQQALPHRHLIGCTGGGVLGAGLEIEGEPGIALLAGILGDDVQATPFHVTRATSPDPDDGPGWEALLGVTAAQSPDFVVLSDPYTFNAEVLINALALGFPEASVVGGLASGGQETAQRNLLFIDDRVEDHGAIGVALTGKVAVETVVAQGCRPIGEPMFVTRAHGSIVYEIDGQPALAQLKRLFGTLSPEDRKLFEHSLFLGVAMVEQRASYEQGDFLIRNLVGAAPDHGGLVVAARIQDRKVVQFHLRDAETSRADLREMLGNASEAFQDEPGSPAAALLFSCLGRGEGLYGQPNHDSSAFFTHFGHRPIAGFFCNGEIGPVGGKTYLHGYTSAFGLIVPRG